jgi:RHS repeat-associated protein
LFFENKYDYDSWGKVSTAQSSANQIGYTGQRLDSKTGLMALGNGERYYSPTLARFIQQDSLTGSLNTPQSLNRFSYVHNNPHKFIDPSGHAGILATIAIGAAVGGLFGGAIEFAHQAVDVYNGEGSFDIGKIGKAAAVGAAVGAVIGSFGLLAGAFGVMPHLRSALLREARLSEQRQRI